MSHDQSLLIFVCPLLKTFLCCCFHCFHCSTLFLPPAFYWPANLFKGALKALWLTAALTTDIILFSNTHPIHRPLVWNAWSQLNSDACIRFDSQIAFIFCIWSWWELLAAMTTKTTGRAQWCCNCIFTKMEITQLAVILGRVQGNFRIISTVKMKQNYYRNNIMRLILYFGEVDITEIHRRELWILFAMTMKWLINFTSKWPICKRRATTDVWEKLQLRTSRL